MGGSAGSERTDSQAEGINLSWCSGGRRIVLAFSSGAWRIGVDVISGLYEPIHK